MEGVERKRDKERKRERETEYERERKRERAQTMVLGVVLMWEKCSCHITLTDSANCKCY